jgi:MYXO-CTERM domain-containing protein
MKLLLAAATFAATLLPAHASVILYTQNFENPNPGSFVNDGFDVNIRNPINALYGGQPAGFQFAQAFTVETLLVGGSQAWNNPSNPTGGFQDPQGKAGRHVVSMLSLRESDLLGLSFNVGSFKFLNLQLDISSIDLNSWGGPFFDGNAPTFEFTLFDNPSSGVTTGSGTVLDSAQITGTIAANQWTFDWTNHIVALDATGNTNGNVTLRIDLLAGGYAAMDNFRIAASDEPRDVGTVPEPSSLILALLGLAALGAVRRRS